MPQREDHPMKGVTQIDARSYELWGPKWHYVEIGVGPIPEELRMLFIDELAPMVNKFLAKHGVIDEQQVRLELDPPSKENLQ